MPALTYRMPSGIPGAISRESQSSIESAAFNSSLPFPAYGVPGKIVNNQVVPLVAGDAPSALYCVLVRPFPTHGANASDPLGTSVPPTTGIASILRRGYISIKLNSGVAANGQPAFVRVNNPNGAKIVNGYEAAPDVTASAQGGITGNGTSSAVTIANTGWITGQYRIVYTSATAFNVFNPNNELIATGVNGTAVNVDGISFTMTAGGTAFVANDRWNFQVNHINSGTFMSAADASGNAELAFNI